MIWHIKNKKSVIDEYFRYIPKARMDIYFNHNEAYVSPDDNITISENFIIVTSQDKQHPSVQIINIDKIDYIDIYSDE